MNKRMTDVVMGIRHTPSSSSDHFRLVLLDFLQVFKLSNQP